MVNNYNEQVDVYCKTEKEESLCYDESYIKWTSSLLPKLKRKEKAMYDNKNLRVSLYRPFCKQWLYFDTSFIHRPYQLPKLFPTEKHKNLVICVCGIGVTKDFTCIMTNIIPDLELIGKSQCFPLYWYEDQKNKDSQDLFTQALSEEERYIRHDGITNWILKTARKQYGKNVQKEDIFYYVYGLLHSPDYRKTFATDLKKSLPRLPLVDKAEDFWAFSKAGRELAELHLNYETIEPYSYCNIKSDAFTKEGDFKTYRVQKMRFGKKDSKTADKSVIIYNSAITINGIPEKAYEYVVNGKSAIEWLMERYAITTDSKSGITNDPNDWAKEQGDEKYILNLLLRIINLSLKSVEIIESLPKLNFEE